MLRGPSPPSPPPLTILSREFPRFTWEIPFSSLLLLDIWFSHYFVASPWAQTVQRTSPIDTSLTMAELAAVAMRKASIIPIVKLIAPWREWYSSHWYLTPVEEVLKLWCSCTSSLATSCNQSWVLVTLTSQMMLLWVINPEIFSPLNVFQLTCFIYQIEGLEDWSICNIYVFTGTLECAWYHTNLIWLWATLAVLGYVSQIGNLVV